jgi:hypothetical protein
MREVLLEDLRPGVRPRTAAHPRLCGASRLPAVHRCLRKYPGAAARWRSRCAGDELAGLTIFLCTATVFPLERQGDSYREPPSAGPVGQPRC